MDSFPSIFSTTTPPDHLSLNNMMIDNNVSARSYIEIQNNKIMGFDISPDDDHSSGLMTTNHGSAAPGQQDVDSRSSSLVSGESTGGDHHHGRLMKMDKVIKKDKKMKKARYAFQTRSQVDILDDGYRWRKYGQKAVKNNRFPRSYYRCTYQGCNVKKQVQRLSKDEEVVVTTYEGMHSHPIEKSTDNFEHILTQMKIYTSS